MCDIAEEEFAELLAWREAVARAEAEVRARRTVRRPAELRRVVSDAEPASASA
jgi:hypothetical protein